MTSDTISEIKNLSEKLSQVNKEEFAIPALIYAIFSEHNRNFTHQSSLNNLTFDPKMYVLSGKNRVNYKININMQNS